MNVQVPLTFNEGVYILPVTDLPNEVLGKIETGDGDFALTRPLGRAGSKIIDRDAADLIARFRQPRTIVEAVVLFSHAHDEDPQAVLESAFPLLKGLLSNGYLVEVVDGVPLPRADGGLSTRWKEGDAALGGRVVRCLQVLEDTELYLLERGAGAVSVLKVERRAQDGVEGLVRAQLQREGTALHRLGGGIAPRLFARGQVDGLAYIEIEYLAGVDAEAEARRLREAGGSASRSALLALATAIARAYATLHARGFLHGDIHPRNLLIGRAGEVRLIDFGLSGAIGEPAPAGPVIRGGVPFFFEPELARDYLAHGPGVRASAAGEQYAVATLIYQLVTGAHARDYSLGREEMLREIAELPPLRFAERGLAPWPALESVLARALAKDPALRYPGLEELAAALACVTLEGADETPPPLRALAGLGDRCAAASDIGGAWEALQALPAPSASINYGAAGVALGLLTIAQARDEARPLALARHWLMRARAAGEGGDGYYNGAIEITPETVGAASPFHSIAGVHAVQALWSRSIGDIEAQAEATAGFLAASAAGHSGLDLTVGRTSSLLGCAILLDALPQVAGIDPSPLVREGDRLLSEIWQELDRHPAIAAASIEYPGMAHGWAGFLYAALLWSATAGTAVPSGVDRRLAELAALARPTGRGLTWPWTLVGEGRIATMSGWCNGSSGYVFLWTLAARMTGSAAYTDLAIGAAWDAWDVPDPSLSLCCGLAGRAYALLNLYRATADSVWLERARTLAARGAAHGAAPADKAHCLWKGELGLAVLAADLEQPASARMPFFETKGWKADTDIPSTHPDR